MGSAVDLGGIQRGEHLLNGDPTAGNELAARETDLPRQRGRPEVLVDQDSCGAVGLERAACLLDVVLTDQPGRCPLEDGQVELAVAVDVAQLESGDRPVAVLADEGEVEGCG